MTAGSIPDDAVDDAVEHLREVLYDEVDALGHLRYLVLALDVQRGVGIPLADAPDLRDQRLDRRMDQMGEHRHDHGHRDHAEQPEQRRRGTASSVSWRRTHASGSADAHGPEHRALADVVAARGSSCP